MSRRERAYHPTSAGTAIIRAVAATILAGLLLATASSRGVAGQAVEQPRFASPEEAVHALLKAVKTSSLDDLLRLFGPDGHELVAASDPATARKNRDVFKVAAAEKWQLVDESVNRKTLVIGHEEWPFPVPLVRDPDGWRFDIAAGKEEIIARRIGRNELAALATVRAYVTAQQRYAQHGHDGQPPGLYAARFRSDAGKENGLYWPTTRGQKRSPLGDLVAQAAEGGHPIQETTAQRSPFQGYYYKILTAQGRAARGGALNYLVKGLMSRGFALVAWPAQYDITGVMTFIVNHDGIVFERDLGPGTAATAEKMSAYNPDSQWRAVK
jgi:hypothetical protein